MTRARSIGAVVVGSLAWAALTACNQTVIQTPLRSFDRPSDVALSCVQYHLSEYDKDARPHGTFEVHPLGDCEPVKAQTLAQPIVSLPATYIPPMGPNQPFTPFVLAMVTQSARGELALVDTAQNKLVDTDPYTPGYGFVPVGKLPEHIRSTQDGCWAITANTDSCDLTKVDVSAVVHTATVQLFPQDLANGTVAATGVEQMPLSVPSTDASGKPTVKHLYARPTWIEMAPENDGGGVPSTHGYEPGGTPGKCIGGNHHAWVALPACQLVVKVNLEAADGVPGTMPKQELPTIEAALRVDQSGVSVVNDLSTLDCPVECAGDYGTGGAPGDLGPVPSPSDMGPPSPTQAFPSALAVDVEPDVSGVVNAGRLIIADAHGERIDIVPFNITAPPATAMGAARSITLDPGDNGLLQAGVNVLRVGRRSEAGKFLYAVARDGSVRVIDLDRETECETNPDPRWTGPGVNLQQTPTSTPPLPKDQQPEARALGCFPLGDPSTPRRSPYAHTPGIALAPGQLPVDVAFVHVDAPPGDPTMVSAPPPASPGLLVGDFAWIITSDGRGSVVNIYDACPAPNQQPNGAGPGTYTRGSCIPDNIDISLSQTVAQFGHPQPMLLDRVSHRLRGGHPRFFAPANEGDNTGTPRVIDSANPCAVAVPPTSPGLPDGGVPDAGGGCGSSVGNLPSLYREPVPPELSPIPGINETRVVYFVDPDRAKTETWVLTWEGVLPGTSRPLGAPLVINNDASVPTANSAYLSDPGGAWCGRGVLAGDKLVFTGCTDDTECDQAAGFQCIRDPGAFIDVTQGMCLPINAAKNQTTDTAIQRCGKLLRSQRKFRILHAQQGQPLPAPPAQPGMPPPPQPPTDLLTLGEIYEPEFTAETGTCTTDADCANITVVPQGTVNGNSGPRNTVCLPDADGLKRCLLPCTNVDKDDECGVDFECAPSAVDGSPRCMRAPIGDATFWKDCMPEGQPYEVHAGEVFTVAGTASGYLATESAGANGECMVPPETMESVRLSQWRVPLTAPACPPNVVGEPLVESIDPAALQSNVCALPLSGNGSIRGIHFENQVFNLVVQLPMSGAGRALVPPDGTSVSMNITGGGVNLITQLGVDVQAQQPRNAVVAPDGQTVYIVDEGKSPAATGLRGQILRLFSPSQSVDTTFVVR